MTTKNLGEELIGTLQIASEQAAEQFSSVYFERGYTDAFNGLELWTVVKGVKQVVKIESGQNKM